MPLITLSDLRKSDGSAYTLLPPPPPVCKPGDFTIAATALEHGHIDGMVSSLVKAGATLKWVYDKNEAKAQKLASKYPTAKLARSDAEQKQDGQRAECIRRDVFRFELLWFVHIRISLSNRYFPSFASFRALP